LNELNNNTKLVKHRFGIVVHPTQQKTWTLKAKVTGHREDHGRERTPGTRIQNRGRGLAEEEEKPRGKFASLGTWFDLLDVAKWITDSGLLVGEIYIGTVERCEIKRKRCFRCQGFGHLAWSYKETPRYGHCAALMNVNEAPQGYGHDVSTAVVNIQPATDSARE
jgi:hypothetical protein